MRESTAISSTRGRLGANDLRARGRADGNEETEGRTADREHCGLGQHLRRNRAARRT